MSFALLEPRLFTADEYLMIERNAAYKSEFWYGRIYARAGASSAHNRIQPCLSAVLVRELSGTGCTPLSSDTKVRTSPEGLFAYPDLTVVCGAEQYHDTRKEVLLNPTALFEILSDSTAKADRGGKWQAYQEIESLRDYVLIAQNEPRIEHFARQDDGRWLYQSVVGLKRFADAFRRSRDAAPCRNLSERYFFAHAV